MNSKTLVIFFIFFILCIFVGCEKSTKPENQEKSEIPTDPLTSWIYCDSTYYFVSGVSNRSNWLSQEPIEGITVYMTNQEINCADLTIGCSTIGDSWVIIEFPSLELAEYNQIIGCMSYWKIGGSYSNISGGLGSAALTFVDTLNGKRVRGWVNFEVNNFFDDGEINRAYGTFNVPFCSAVLDSEYFP